MTASPAPDPIVDAVAAAREPGALGRVWSREWSRWSGVERDDLGAELMQVYYRPGDVARLVARADWGLGPTRVRGRPTYLFLQLYADPARAEARLARAQAGKRGLSKSLPTAFHVPEWRAIGWCLPNGPRLRSLRSLIKKRPFERFVERCDLGEHARERTALPELVRYVPRRRAVLRWPAREGSSVPPLYIKLYAAGLDAVAARNLLLVEGLADAGGLSTPRLVHHDPHRRAIVMSAVPGAELTDGLVERPPAVWGRLATALEGLYGSGIEPPLEWHPSQEVAAIEAGAADLARAMPTLEPRIRTLLERLARTPWGAPARGPAPIHANLFGDQLLLDGDQVGLVDWDDLALGDPLYDLARLAAHVLFEHARAGAPAPVGLADLFARRDHGRGRDGDLRAHLAGALLMRAKISALRTLAPAWPATVELAVELAEQCLDGGLDAARGFLGAGATAD